jgi:hypothetical protein
VDYEGRRGRRGSVVRDCIMSSREQEFLYVGGMLRVDFCRYLGLPVREVPGDLLVQDSSRG